MVREIKLDIGILKLLKLSFVTVVDPFESTLIITYFEIKQMNKESKMDWKIHGSMVGRIAVDFSSWLMDDGKFGLNCRRISISFAN